MRRIPSPPEIAGYTILSIFGLSMLYEGTVHQETAILISGAVCFLLSIIALVSALRNVLWHRQMLRQSARAEEIGREKPSSEYEEMVRNDTR
jgi:hypothetical protein